MLETTDMNGPSSPILSPSESEEGTESTSHHHAGTLPSRMLALDPFL